MEMNSKIKGWLLYLNEDGQDKKTLKILLGSDKDLKSAPEMKRGRTI